ncbi:hypothetical protein, partial [Paenibacillus sp. KS1]|uniref:hypothetical protein n=1 Tax=Paenibacillus sp. KS1 TaxID=1849249 RepID=UPI001C2F270D
GERQRNYYSIEHYVQRRSNQARENDGEEIACVQAHAIRIGCVGFYKVKNIKQVDIIKVQL